MDLYYCYTTNKQVHNKLLTLLAIILEFGALIWWVDVNVQLVVVNFFVSYMFVGIFN